MPAFAQMAAQLGDSAEKLVVAPAPGTEALLVPDTAASLAPDIAASPARAGAVVKTHLIRTNLAIHKRCLVSPTGIETDPTEASADASPGSGKTNDPKQGDPSSDSLRTKAITK